MRGRRWGSIGGALLILGGLVEAGAFAIGTLVSLPESTLLGAGILSAYAAGAVCIGLGLIATGVALPGRGRTAAKVAGVLALVVPVVNGVQGATGAPLGPAPSQLAYFLFVVAVVVTALRLLSDRRQPAAARWSVAVPAACFGLSVVTLYLPPLAPPGIAVLPWIGVAVAGVLLRRSAVAVRSVQP